MTRDKDCPMRHDNGNCLSIGGFCTSVNDSICEALHNSYKHGKFDAICPQKELRQMEWISVNDRLPERRDFVLVACLFVPESRYEVPRIAELRRSGMWYSDDGCGIPLQARGIKVTHWMPLPEPPKGENESGG